MSDDAAQQRASAKGRRAGLARVAKMTPEELSAEATERNLKRWAKWRAERGIETAPETTATRTPADDLDGYLDDVMREHPEWSLAQQRKAAAIRQRKAAADLAWEVLKAQGDRVVEPMAFHWDEDEE